MSASPLDNDKKLNVVFRVEPGSLGPKGMEYVEDYCVRAQQELGSRLENFVSWQFVPRYDKSKPEIEYGVGHKKITNTQAEKYLSLFGQDMEDFETELVIGVSRLINVFFGRT
jgi:hypothetical protein